MQVFIIGTPLETAKILDKRRLNKQIIECRQIIDALKGKSAWSNHPCVLQYKGCEEWLESYYYCLLNYYFYLTEDNFVEKDAFLIKAKIYNNNAMEITPSFHISDYFNQMKRRLYTKDKTYYKQFETFGFSEENWYFVDGDWRKYINGKRIN